MKVNCGEELPNEGVAMADGVLFFSGGKGYLFICVSVRILKMSQSIHFKKKIFGITQYSYPEYIHIYLKLQAGAGFLARREKT